MVRISPTPLCSRGGGATTYLRDLVLELLRLGGILLDTL